MFPRRNTAPPILTRLPAICGGLRLSSLTVVLALLAALPAMKAAPCSYGEVFDFASTTAGGVSQTGTLPTGDIDRVLGVSVTVTNTGGGSLPTGVVGGGSSSYMASANEYFFPSFTPTASPSYGHYLYLGASNGTGSTETPLTFTFSKSMQNLVMNLQGGDNKVFTFTDGSGNPLTFTLRSAAGSFAGGSANGLADPPTTGDGTNSFYVKQLTTNSIAIGETGYATIQFTNPVTVINMTEVYVRSNPLVSPATFNTTSSPLKVNFGQYCDQVGLVDTCLAPHPANWLSSTTTTATGRIVDETGKSISVTYAGGITSGGGISAIAGFHNKGGTASGGATGGGFMFPMRPAMSSVQTSVNYSSGSPGVMTWTFGESVRNPMLYVAGGSGAAADFKFYKADGTTPLPFILRDVSDSDSNRQVDQNELYAQFDANGLFQFVGDTTAIVMKVSGVTATSGTFASSASVIMNCNGALTSSSGAIDKDTDGDGVSDLQDKCPNTPTGAIVGTDGCPLPTDLSIGKTASVSTITPGVPFNYIITVTNTGAEADNVKASDVIPAGLTINSSTASDSGTVTTTGQTVQALWSIVPAGATRILTINVTKP